MKSLSQTFSVSTSPVDKNPGNLTLLVKPFSSLTASYLSFSPSETDSFTTALSQRDVLKLNLFTWSCKSQISTWPSILPKNSMLGLFSESVPVDYMTSVLGEMKIGVGMILSVTLSPSFFSLKSNIHSTKL